MIKNNVVLAIKNVSFMYHKDEPVLKDVSFEIKQGEYVALIGHNGSGKSTITKLIMGLLDLTDGEIYIYDEKLTNETLYSTRKHLGIVFQNPDNQFIASSVKEDIAFGLENDCVKEDRMKEIVLEYAKKVGMDEFLDKTPNLLSGGQKQRVAIAGCLARNPDILILDEATSMLDPKGKREILDLILKLKQEKPKLTILSITHDIDEAYQCDHIIVLNNGEKVLDGNKDEVFKDESLLKQYHLEIPFALKLKNELIKQGIDVSNCSNVKEIMEFLCK